MVLVNFIFYAVSDPKMFLGPLPLSKGLDDRPPLSGVQHCYVVIIMTVFFSLPFIGFQKACLEAHNDFRYFHGVPLLKWSAKLTSDAQAWANHLAASGKFEHDPSAPGKGQGENLYYATFQPLPKRLCAYGEQKDCLSCEEIVQAWYDEEADYDYDTGKPKTPDAVIGHFTQLIWKATKDLGMATAVAGNKVVAVARYSPAGNWEGEFKKNVPRPINA